MNAPFSHMPSLPSTPVTHLLKDATDYWVDTFQRMILTTDVLRQRGNIYLEHGRAGNPPVLVFDYEMVMDGRKLERPTNYALVRILPPAEYPTDPKKRPFVVIDPRAGHGPGIGGSKIDSEVGIALRGGHPCYFIMFFPEPEPGQTIECVGYAEVEFLRKVVELHKGSEGMPLVIGNCQGGWALIILAALAPELVGPILLAGTPLSYWAGVEGKNPMRYNGGLAGGTWPASFVGDLGAGKFDGAWLVHNFEQLNPANTYWGKQYNLYANVDTEAERFLTFERWWGGHYLLNREEIDWIVQNLFVGNRLSSGDVVSSDGRHRVDVHNIRSPIIVFASWGDNITPPQQALNWIPDAYVDVEDIRTHGQTIVYCLHEHIGHLGIFVSAGVARRETSELVSAIDLIDTLPPGLYEAVIEDGRPDMPALELINGRYLIRFEPREVSDILALGDGRQHENRFELVRRVAEINQALYDQFMSPLVRAFSNEFTAAGLRALHPSRVERYTVSDLNPFLWPLGAFADMVRKKRAKIAEDNPFLTAERRVSDMIEKSLDQYREHRDHGIEELFKHMYGSPWLATLLGARRTRREPVSLRAQLEKLNIKAALNDFETGGRLDAFVRIMAYVHEDHVVDERPFNLMRRIVDENRVEPITLAQYRDSVQRQSFVLMLDERRALNALPKLVPDQSQRDMVIGFVYEILTAVGPIQGRVLERFEEACSLFGAWPRAAHYVSRQPKAEVKSAPVAAKPARSVKPAPAKSATAVPATPAKTSRAKVAAPKAATVGAPQKRVTAKPAAPAAKAAPTVSPKPVEAPTKPLSATQASPTATMAAKPAAARKRVAAKVVAPAVKAMPATPAKPAEAPAKPQPATQASPAATTVAKPAAAKPAAAPRAPRAKAAPKDKA